MSEAADSKTFIHPSCHIDPRAKIGERSKVWINVQVRENVEIGRDCILGKDIYIDIGVKIGNRCKIQNGVSVFAGVTLEDDVFVGPNACFTNDKTPRAFNRDWEIVKTLVKKGASIGANATVICGVIIGEYAMVAAGSVVTRDVAPRSLVIGVPARHHAWVDENGHTVADRPGMKRG